jgi:NhaP-type Na+/H+ or K+/H+ antiporter
MTLTIQLLVLLLAVVAAVAVLANRLKIPPAILLVLAGVLLALIPGLPSVELASELVLLLILPPFIYTSAFQMSWREFQFNLRPITLLSVGSVVFTTIMVAAAVHSLMDIEWPVAFVLASRCESEVLEVRPSRSRPNQGLIKLHTTTLNQNNETVQVQIGNLVVPRRQSLEA